MDLYRCGRKVAISLCKRGLTTAPSQYQYPIIQKSELALCSQLSGNQEFQKNSLRAINFRLLNIFYTFLFLFAFTIVAQTGSLLATFLVLLPEALRFVSMMDSMAANMQQIIY